MELGAMSNNWLEELQAHVLGRVLFDYVDPDVDETLDINYDVAYIQPGIIALSANTEAADIKLLQCTWLACSNEDKQVIWEFQLLLWCSNALLCCACTTLVCICTVVVCQWHV